MTTFQKISKYLAMAFAVFLTVCIIGGILSAVGLFGGIFGLSAVTEDLKTYTVSANITSLDIEINAADFTVKQADDFSVESNLTHLTVTEKDGTLRIKEEKKLGSLYTDAVLILYVPSETVFEKAEIVTGAGRLTVDSLSADLLNLELGAGEVNIGSLSAAVSADIDGGAGKITIADGTLCNVNFDMGVGQFNLSAAILGKSEFDLGIGESNITLIGDKNDYSVDIEKGVGGITVDGKSLSEYDNFGNGQNIIDISGGIGAVNLRFKSIT